MKAGFVGLGMLLACAIAPMGVRGEDNFINWRSNYQDALREARETQKPVFLEFRCEA